MAESLAVRYRPRRFADVAGQRHVSAPLRAAAARQDPPQQLLLSGDSGLGKTTLARIFAAALFCPNRTDGGDACGACESCDDVTGNGHHPDVIELDAASNGGKDEIREIAQRASLAPLRAPWKMYIIDEAHGLTGPGGQAFLTLLEQPPKHVLFVLATTDPQKLPTALRGRCMQCEVLRPTATEISANLLRIAGAEQWPLTDELAAAVIDATDPALGMRGTVMTLEKLSSAFATGQSVTDAVVEDLLGSVAPGRLRELTEAITAGDRAAALLTLSQLSSRTGFSHIRRQLTSWAREQLLQASAGETGFETAYHRYETLVEAGSYDGALDIAVARMCRPDLDANPQATRSLLEQAQLTLTALRQRAAGAPATMQPAAPMSGPSAAPATEAPPAPVVATVPPVERAPEVAPPRADGAPATWAEQDTMMLLNGVSRTSAKAGMVLRKCAVHRRVDGTLLVMIEADLIERAAGAGLPALLDEQQVAYRQAA